MCIFTKMILAKLVYNIYLKRKTYFWVKDNIWDEDLADMKLISKYNKGIRYLLSVIDLFPQYSWFVVIKDKKLLLRSYYC